MNCLNIWEPYLTLSKYFSYSHLIANNISSKKRKKKKKKTKDKGASNKNDMYKEVLVSPDQSSRSSMQDCYAIISLDLNASILVKDNKSQTTQWYGPCPSAMNIIKCNTWSELKEVICTIHCPKICKNDLRLNASDIRPVTRFCFPSLFISMCLKVASKKPSECISLGKEVNSRHSS